MPTWLYVKWDRVTPPVQHRNAKPVRPPAAVRAGRPKSLVGSGSLSASKSASRPMSAESRANNLPTGVIPPRTSEKDSAAKRSFGRSTVFAFEVIIIYVCIQIIKILLYRPSRQGVDFFNGRGERLAPLAGARTRRVARRRLRRPARRVAKWVCAPSRWRRSRPRSPLRK